MSERFNKAKADFIAQGYTEKQSVTMAALATGETDGSVIIPPPVDTSNWTSDDWYKNNLKIGMSDDDARFAAAIASGEIDINDPTVDYS